MHWPTAARRCGMVPGCRPCWGDCNWELTSLHTMGVALSSRCAFASDLTVIWLVESDLWEISNWKISKNLFFKRIISLATFSLRACLFAPASVCVITVAGVLACGCSLLCGGTLQEWQHKKRRPTKSYEKNGSKRKMRPFVSCEVHNQLWPHPDSCWLKRSMKHCLHFHPFKE